ncbi:hypothetical protein [Pseudomonas sp. GD03730]|uniref:defense against restriction DarA-related protein n=1 Tax=Pseudomonas sp. GD03730 TaxID=2975375 RepID=UPI002446BECF|nr:hypothetical protein [Pseudomonas sp. GD03730]MDH1403755.1 hypothetical protein [Pseudomonas sp. GD03730]
MPITNALDFSSASAAEGALKKVKQWMVRAGQPVVATEFIDKPRRSNSITYREATLTLASGQLITLRVISTGDIYQAVLNKSVVPIKNHDDMAKAVAELASAAEKNQAAFQKSLARVKVSLPPGMSTPKPKMAEALQQRVAELDGQIAERKATVADLQQQLGAMTDSTGGASSAPELDDAARDVLRALGERGPLDDGDVPSKSGRDVLEHLGYIDRYTAAGANVLNDKGREALAMLDSVPAPSLPAGPEPMSWLGFKLVNQAYVDQVGPMEVPSRFQIGADVFLGLGQDGDKMDIAAKVIGASFRAAKVHYTLAVPTEVVGDQQMYAVLHDVDSVSVATADDLLDNTKQPMLVDSLEAFKEPQPEWPAMSLAVAYVDARDVLGTDPAMLDSAANADAVAVLRMALDVMETNYPINIKAGNFDQAALQKRNADAYRRAIAMLDSAPVAISDAGLAQLVAIAAVSAAESSEIADQEALAELLALGMVEAESGLYLITGKGINALDDAGYDSMGEPYATSDD